MKKILAIVLAAVMIAACSVTAFAAEVNQDTTPPTGATNVTVSVAPSYTVTIPETVVLNEQQDGTYSNSAVITATNIRLNSGKVINVTMDSDFLLENAQGAAALPYTLKINDTEKASGDTVATFSTNADLTFVQQSDTLQFTAEVPTYAGDYSDTVTFNIAITDEA